MAWPATFTGISGWAPGLHDMQAAGLWGEAALVLFRRWQGEAGNEKGHDATAMVLATATAGGLPSARMVKLKSCDARGFAFYTNLGSRKAMDIRENRHAALLFDWPHVGKRVYVHGKVELVRAAEADAYFATRPKLSRIGAWASRQSQPLRHRWRLWLRIGCMVAKWATRRMSRPSFWSGFRLVPREIYFERIKETIGHPAAHPSPHHEGSAG